MNWSLSYGLDDFPVATPAFIGTGKAPVPSLDEIVPRSIDDLSVGVSEVLKQLIRTGDDSERPRGGHNPRHPSRSHSVFAGAHGLARAGCDETTIAGILLDPRNGISASVLEKRNPKNYALRQARRATEALAAGWIDVERSGKPRSSMRNTLQALERLELTFSYDRFRHRKMLNGAALQEFQGELSDDAVAMVRALIIAAFGFDPRAENVRDAVNQHCLENSFHPVCDMLDSLEWDGKPRIDAWLVDYLGAENTALNRAIGPIILIAAARRVRVPGVKFDQIPILEGPQGSGKSTALRIMAGEGFHSDQEILTQDSRSQMELLEGIWIYELGEVEGFNRAEVNKIKAFASRQEDRSRMAYGRFVEARPRQAVFIGTTNETTYLRDQTGNRRFWPIKTTVIDLEGLRRDRAQLWAEAAHRERQGESIILSPNLWETAAVEQAARLEEDPWLELLATVKGRASGHLVRVGTHELLGKLKIEAERQNQFHTKRLAIVMRKLGWEPTKFRVGEYTIRGYERPKPEGHVDAQEF
ncbi:MULTISPECIES: virulence-associated E family protein [unclassified Mesorhizobium]|uniref:virulence-associated E family protein n=1 Tax=unclassified Mesorhizobium TaxID=325217 RepID=UPI003338453A